MRELQQMVANFVADRPVMRDNNSDPQEVWKLLLGELDEAKIEIDSGNRDNLAHELPDIMWFLMTLANIYGIDLEDEFRTKGARNLLKRPASEWQTGTYQECNIRSRERWTPMMENEFYQLDQLPPGEITVHTDHAKDQNEHQPVEGASVLRQE